MNRKLAFVSALAILIGTVGVVWLRAAPSIGTTAVSPTVVGVNTPTQVTVTALIADSSLIPTSVSLLRVDSQGNTLANLGAMFDTGTNGDSVPGDKTFTRVVFLSEDAGHAYFRVSAAFRGLPRRINSTSVSVAIWTFHSNSEDDYSMPYPPYLNAFQTTKGKTVFSFSPAAPEGDQPAPIEAFVLPGTLQEHLAILRSSYSAALDERTVTITGRSGVQLSGVLDENVFGWGGERHSYLVIPLSSGGILRIGFDITDPAIEAAIPVIVNHLSVN